MSKYNKNYALSNEDVQKIAGDDTKVINYPDLYQYKSIEQLFNNTQKVIILYLTDVDHQDQSYFGHWVALTIRENHIVFFDSYGYMPDSEIKFNKSQQKREELNQTSNYLTKLLYEYCLKGKIVEYNQYKFQKKGGRIATCGRWASIQTRFKNIPLDTFQKVFITLRKNGHNLDDVVTDLTNNFL